MDPKYMHGCGNSFFVIDNMGSYFPIDDIQNVYLSLDGRMVVDGILVLSRSDSADVRMNYFNVLRGTRNVERSKMCGNGIRCLSRFASDHGYVGRGFDVETDDGIKKVVVDGGHVTVDMGCPHNFQKVSETDYYVEVGIPHYVRFTDNLEPDVIRAEGKSLRDDRILIKRLGAFDNMLNYNGVRIDGSHDISLITRECGVEDVTLACGTGSCSSAYVSHAAREMKFPISVHNRGGVIHVDEGKKGNIVMTGPAEYITI